ncbi:hypothetical protein QTJ16_000902 [Diplocarpon rosae]|uniref:Uncharacterized protein n=1 Tax=Diplocarpon rosae TaxID=946125 RepID=A0AAD9T767_9HELO|nr:hypothetical protein QTJ16_000902 [Diplocarpon rosae]
MDLENGEHGFFTISDIFNNRCLRDSHEINGETFNNTRTDIYLQATNVTKYLVSSGAWKVLFSPNFKETQVKSRYFLAVPFTGIFGEKQGKGAVINHESSILENHEVY